MKNLITIIIVLTLVSGCTSNNMNKANIGSILGAVGGAFAAKDIGKGNGQVLSIAAGTVVGQFVGHSIGASLDRADIVYYSRTYQGTLEQNKSGIGSSWINPDSGNRGIITPTRTYQNGNVYCREFTQSITIGNQARIGYGKACRQLDGSWSLI